MVQPKQGYQVELQARDATAEELRNTADREDLSRSLGLLGGDVFPPSRAFTETRLKDNSVLLLAGEHGSGIVRRPGTVITGQRGTVLKSPWVVEAPGVTTFVNVRFRAVSDLPLVSIGAQSRVLFTNCVFDKPDPYATSDFVRITSGGKALFTGVLYTPAKSAGTVVNNLGAVANVSTSGFNVTGQAHVNVTVISEIS